jgi:hypothetical protein
MKKPILSMVGGGRVGKITHEQSRRRPGWADRRPGGDDDQVRRDSLNLVSSIDSPHSSASRKISFSAVVITTPTPRTCHCHFSG